MDAENRPRGRRLAEVVREMKTADAGRLDVAARGEQAARRRLEQLSDELEEIYEEAGGEEAGFDFNIASGPTPRLWIDAATHVSVEPRDGQTFRIMRDARGGRMVLGETNDVDEAADIVTRYVGQRIVERERLLDAAAPVAAGAAGASAGSSLGRARPAALNVPEREVRVVRKPSRFSRFIRAIIWFGLGVLAGLALTWIAYGERIGLENPVPPEYRPFYEPYVPALPGDAAPAAGVVSPDPGNETETGAGGEPTVVIETPGDGGAAAPAADAEIVPVEPVPADGDEAATDNGGAGAE